MPGPLSQTTTSGLTAGEGCAENERSRRMRWRRASALAACTRVECRMILVRRAMRCSRAAFWASRCRRAWCSAWRDQPAAVVVVNSVQLLQSPCISQRLQWKVEPAKAVLQCCSTCPLPALRVQHDSSRATSQPLGSQNVGCQTLRQEPCPAGGSGAPADATFMVAFTAPPRLKRHHVAE